MLNISAWPCHPGSRPSRVWSFWEMAANFRFAEIDALMVELRHLIVTSHQNMRVIESRGGLGALTLGDPDYIEAVRQANEAVKFVTQQTVRLMSGLRSQHINDADVRLRYWLKENPQTWSELNTLARSLRDAIDTELKQHLYFQYPLEKGKRLRSYKVDWHRAITAFPDIDSEVFSAVDCYAMEQNTASVFHSMRVAEYGLRALAHERKIKLKKNKPLEWGTWQDIIKELDAEIGRIGIQKPAGRTKDAALEFYSGARADLNGFKDEFRNKVMHVRAAYDEHQALRAD